MPQPIHHDPTRTWQSACRSAFGLSARETATLVAIVAYYRMHATAIPHDELLMAANNPDNGEIYYEMDAIRGPSTLWREGLIERFGPPHERSFLPTKRGLRRAFA